LLPKTPTNKKKLQQRHVTKKDSDGGGSRKTNASRRLSRNLANEFLSSSQATDLADCDLDRVLDRSAPVENYEEQLLARSQSHAPPPVVTNSFCSVGQSPDCTQTNFFPELGDR